MNHKLLIPMMALIVSGCFLTEQKRQVQAEETSEVTESVSTKPMEVPKDIQYKGNSSGPKEIDQDMVPPSPFPSLEKIKAMVPDYWSIVQTKSGPEIVYDDFTQDGLIDVALLLVFGEKETYEMEDEVMIRVLAGTKDGGLERIASTGNLSGSSIRNQQRPHLSSKKGVLSYHHESMRNELEIKYRFDRKEWFMVQIGKEYNDYGSTSSPPFAISINYLTGKKIVYPKAWDEKTEALVDQPEEVTTFEAFQMPLHMLDFESLYAQIEDADE